MEPADVEKAEKLRRSQLERSRRYEESHKEQMREKRRAYYLAHREELREKKKVKNKETTSFDAKDRATLEDEIHKLIGELESRIKDLEAKTVEKYAHPGNECCTRRTVLASLLCSYCKGVRCRIR
jgi:hypothetical protein